MKTKMKIVAIALVAMSLTGVVNNTDAQVRAHISIGLPIVVTPPVTVYPDNGQYYYPQSGYYQGSGDYRHNNVRPYYGYRNDHGGWGDRDRHDRGNKMDYRRDEHHDNRDNRDNRSDRSRR